MKYLLYDILLAVFFIILIPYFMIKMLTARKYRQGIPERFGFIRKEKLAGLKGGKAVWIHAVSVGETKAALPVLRLLKKTHPGIKTVFSTVTATGQRTAENEGAGLIDALIYFPLDFSCVIKRVIRLINPSALIVVEKEVWPNLLHIMDKSGAPVVVVNGTISERSFRRFTKLRFFFGDIFGAIGFFCARTAEDARRAVLCGVKKDRVATTGNVKFDINPPHRDEAYLSDFKNALGLDGAYVIVAGSTHPGEEEIMLEMFKRLKDEFKGIRLVIAPRHPERFSGVESLLRKSGVDYSRRSEGKRAGTIVLLDSLGELMTAYSFSTVAIVGGSLVPGIGGHNLLEPALYGKPVLYGPYLSAYLNMAELLESSGGGIRVKDLDDFYGKVKKLLLDEGLRSRTGDNARKAVESNRGAAKKTVDIIDGVFLKSRGI